MKHAFSGSSLQDQGQPPVRSNILRISAALILLIFFLNSHLTAQMISEGLGSYTLTLPSGQVGPQLMDGNNAVPKTVDGFSKPIQTNDFWSSLIYPFSGNPHSNILYAHPVNARAVASGLEIGYTSEPIYVAADYLFPYAAQLTVGIEGLNAAQTQTLDYGDWTVTALWESGEKRMEATLGHGLPFVYFEISGGNAVISCAQSPNIFDAGNGIMMLTVDGRHFGVFPPAGSTWSGTTTMVSDLSGEGYLSVALLPDDSPETLELFRRHAYAFVTDSRVEWTYDEPGAQLTSVYTLVTAQKDSSEDLSRETLNTLYRHQWQHTGHALTGHSYSSPRGEMKLMEGNSFSTVLQFQGIMPALPDRGDYNRQELLQLVQAAAAETLPEGPTYENGKLMARFSNLVYIADQLGAVTERDHFLDELKSRLEEWLTAGGAQQYHYNEQWNVLTGYPSGYGADNQINDHHFHSSYAIMSAATIARYDSIWASQDQWGAMIELLIKDAGNWDREDTRFPFLRTHDIYAGHSWAAGHGDFAEGNNQESSSESMNFAAAVFLWGSATGRLDIRDLGIFLHATEATAVENYWFDVDNEVFPEPYPHVALGMVWGGKGVHSTWFGAEPEFIHGINLLPITAASLYLGRYPEYVLKNHAEIVAERNGAPVIWKDILWEYLALADPGAAMAGYYSDINYEPFDGESRAHTMHWLYNMKKLGQVRRDISADIPSYAVFQNGDNTTYTAYNPGGQTRLVTFSDGTSLELAPWELSSRSSIEENTDLPVVLLFADKTSGKVPLSVEFSGSRSFDRSGSDLEFEWNFGGEGWARAADTVYTFTEVGTFTVGLTVTNALGFSGSDSLQITVLGNGTPYSGVPVLVPGIVQAEFYDLGGEGRAYHDNDAANKGVPFRSEEGVDIEASNDLGGGYDIGWIEDGEWVEYTVTVPEDGSYDILPVTASVPGGGMLQISFDGVDRTGKLSVPVTGGWQFWEEILIPDVELSAGTQVMHVDFFNGEFNLNWIEIRKSESTDLDAAGFPEKFELYQNYPNPFNPSTRISYSLARAGNYSLVIYDVGGREIHSRQLEHSRGGYYEQDWEGRDTKGQKVPSGIYLYRLTGPYGDGSDAAQSLTGKMLLLK